MTAINALETARSQPGHRPAPSPPRLRPSPGEPLFPWVPRLVCARCPSPAPGRTSVGGPGDSSLAFRGTSQCPGVGGPGALALAAAPPATVLLLTLFSGFRAHPRWGVFSVPVLGALAYPQRGFAFGSARRPGFQWFYLKQLHVNFLLVGPRPHVAPLPLQEACAGLLGDAGHRGRRRGPRQPCSSARRRTQETLGFGVAVQQ